MTRVLFVHAGNMYGGVERVLETLAGCGARAHGLDLRFAVCFEGRLSEALREQGAAVDILGPVRLTRPHLVLRGRSRLTAILKREAPDVVITTSAWAHAAFAPAVRGRHLRLATWVHDLLAGRSWLERIAGRWQPDLMICNSVCSEAAARSVYPAVPATVIHGPVASAGPSVRRGRIRRETGTPDDAVVMVLAGRMVRMKGHARLLSALAELPSTVPWRCWIVGAAQRPEEERYERELKSLGVRRVSDPGSDTRLTPSAVFLGQRTDVAEILADADVYCQPNEAPESFGLSFVEALRAGLPVVTTDIGGAREIVTADCGRLVPVNDQPALTATLHELLTNADLRRELGRHGAARARTLCDPAVACHQLRDAVAALRHKGAA